MYPFMPILRPGPISIGREKRARRGAALEFTEERSCFRRVIPSPDLAILVTDADDIGASGSEDEEG